jgi:hypothetical protein
MSSGYHHSVLFVKYVDDAFHPTNSTRIETIEGNSGHGRVAVCQRTLSGLRNVGSTR